MQKKCKKCNCIKFSAMIILLIMLIQLQKNNYKKYILSFALYVLCISRLGWPQEGEY